MRPGLVVKWCIVTHGRVEISCPAAATPMTVDIPHPLWQASSAALITCTYTIHLQVPVQTSHEANSTYVSSTIKRVIQTPICDVNKMVLDLLTLRQVERVDDFVCSELLRYWVFAGVSVDGDDTASSD